MRKGQGIDLERVRLANLLKREGLTQQEVAERVGLEKRTVQNYQSPKWLAEREFEHLASGATTLTFAVTVLSGPVEPDLTVSDQVIGVGAAGERPVMLELSLSATKRVLHVPLDICIRGQRVPAEGVPIGEVGHLLRHDASFNVPAAIRGDQVHATVEAVVGQHGYPSSPFVIDFSRRVVRFLDFPQLLEDHH